MKASLALPFIAERVHDATEYVELRSAAQETIQAFAAELDTRKVTVHVNTADNVEAGTVYLTLAEMGDDGAVGQGNRVDGQWRLIDFKADELLNEEALEMSVERYRPQMRRYAAAARQLIEEDVRIALCFLDFNGEVMRVELQE